MRRTAWVWALLLASSVVAWYSRSMIPALLAAATFLVALLVPALGDALGLTRSKNYQRAERIMIELADNE
jgi:CHASE2 domain-containing sensor protein